MFEKILVALTILSLSFSTVSSAEVLPAELTLEESIRIALANNHLLHAAEKEMDRADLARKAVRSDFLPKLNTEFQYTRFDETPYFATPGMPGMPVEGSAEIEIPPNPPVDVPFKAMTPATPPGKVPAGEEEQRKLTVSIQQPIFTGLAILNKYRLAAMEQEAVAEQFQKARQGVMLKVIEGYFTILKTEKLAEVAKQAVEQLGAHVKTAESFFEQGVIAKNDLLKAEVKLANVRYDFTRVENAVVLAKSAFNTVLGLDVDTPVNLTGVLAYAPYNRALEGCIRAGLSQRPEIHEARIRHDQARKGVQLARSTYFPHLALVGSYTNEVGGFLADEDIWTFVAVAQWTVWDWGKTYYQVGREKARTTQAYERMLQVRDGIALEVKHAYLDLRVAERNIGVSRKAAAQAKENFRITEAQYEQNMTTTTEVLDAQTLLTQARSNYYNALSDYNIALARLKAAMGELSEAFGVEQRGKD